MEPSGAPLRSIAAVAESLLPSTVQISAEFEGESGAATGSGFVLDRQGHVITNNHVVADAAEEDGQIEIVDQDGNRYDATVVFISAYKPIDDVRLRREQRDTPPQHHWRINPTEDVDATLRDAEEKAEEKEESDDDMGFGLFD